MTNTIHIIGAGLAGLSAAVYLANAGKSVCVYESSGHAGGRCRSFIDKKLGAEINNGNHLLVGANKEALRFINKIGGEDNFAFAENSALPFTDVKTRAEWQTSLPFLDIPDVKKLDYIKSLSLLLAGDKTVEQCLGNTGVLYERLWKPMTESILNTPPNIASARMLRHILRLLIFGKDKALTPYVSGKPWSPALINPAVDYIQQNGGDIFYNHRLQKISFKGSDISKLVFTEHDINVRKEDKVIFATPPDVLSRLVQSISTPTGSHVIVNAHFKIDSPDLTKKIEEKGDNIIGLTGGVSHWLFFHDDIISVTISAADKLSRKTEDAIIKIIWKDVQNAISNIYNIELLSYVAVQVIKEKRATFSCTNENAQKRPNATTPYGNLFIAGDFTNTGLPATIESAIKSGRIAAGKII